jgi:glycosyltransferase involved in cell wall biosynthesis
MPPPRSAVSRAASTLLSPWPDLALRLRSRDYSAALARLLKEEGFDVVQIEGLEMAPFVQGLLALKYPSRPLMVYDAHNAEFRLQESIYQAEREEGKSWLGAFYSGRQWRKLRSYERSILARCDRVVAVSEQDARSFRELCPGVQPVVIPNGVDTQLFQPHWGLEQEADMLVFTGKMDFRPNVDAMVWFCGRIFRLIREQVAPVQMYIVGQSPARQVETLEHDPGVVVTGWVEDDRDYIARARVYVAPLRMGGGTRLKILRAMAMGKAIVATTLACEGIELAGDELVRADTVTEFATAVVELWEDPLARRRLSQRARALVEAHYDWRVVVPRFREVYGDGQG